MRRREFITLLAGAAVAWPLAARAQQPAMPVIGFLSSASPDLYAIRLRAFRQGLKEAGYVEGQNVAIEYRWAEGQIRSTAGAGGRSGSPSGGRDCRGGGTPAALAAKAATATIPIVFAVAVDPVKIGLVASLNRPGGNLTGVTNLNVEIGPKRLELLHELVPTATIIALLVNPTNPYCRTLFASTCRRRPAPSGCSSMSCNASTDRDFDTVFATLVQLRAGALVIGADTFFTSRSEQLAALTLRHAVPAIYPVSRVRRGRRPDELRKR